MGKGILANKNQRKPQLFIFSDSQGRGLASCLREIQSTFQIHSTVCPNARMGQLVNLVRPYLPKIRETGVLVLIGGTNNTFSDSQQDISDYDSAILELSRVNCRVIVLPVPPRYDDEAAQHRVKNLNDLLLLKRHEGFGVPTPLTQRFCYTRHGLHINRIGKIYLARKIMRTISLGVWYPRLLEMNKVTEGICKPPLDVENFPCVLAPMRSAFSDHLRYYEDVFIGRLRLRSLIDSGASSSFINSKYFHDLQKNGVKLTACSSNVQVANGQISEIVGFCTAPINIGDTVWVGKLNLMKQMPYDMILGVDFLRQMRAVFDFHQGKLVLKSNSQFSHVPLMELAATSSPLVPGTDTPIDIADASLTASQVTEATVFISKWVEKFKLSPGTTDVVTHKIYLKDKDLPPFKQRYYNYSPAVERAIDEQIAEWLRDGVIEESDTPYTSPLLAVKKKDTDKLRVCVDMRLLNKRSYTDAYPLPRIHNLLDTLKDANYISTVDLATGFLQIKIDEDSQRYTGIATKKGLYHFKKMCYGLSSAPATFSRLMTKVLQPLLYKNCLVYVDDIIVWADTYEKHLQVLDEVFTLLFNAGLILSWRKCHFFKEYCEYLGFKVGQGKIIASPSKTECISNYPRPNTVKGVRGFLGLSGWYRRLICDYATTAEPLTRLLKKNQPFVWGEEQEKAFQAIKDGLVKAPELYAPDFEREFVMFVDSSNVGTGAVLSQFDDKGVEHVVAFHSKTLNKAQRNYSVTERECLGVILGLEAFRGYIQGTHCTVYTDHSSLTWLMNIAHPEGKLCRYITRLSLFDFTIKFRKGKNMEAPDALSRIPYALSAAHVTSKIPSFSKVQDPWYIDLISRVKANPQNFPSFQVTGEFLFKKIHDKMLRIDQFKLYVPNDFRFSLIKENHDSLPAGHVGIAKTVSRITRQYYWPSLKRDVTEYVHQCDVCQGFKPSNTLPMAEMIPKVHEMSPFQLVYLDFIGSLPSSSKQNKYALVMQDASTKFLIATPMRAATTQSAIKAITDQLILVHGCPSILVADQGSQFTSKAFSDFCEEFNIKLHLVPKMAPFCNSVERYNRSLKQALSMFSHANQREWDDHLKYVVFAWNTAKNDTTSFTAYELAMGRAPKGFFELFDPVLNAQVGVFDPKTYRNTVKERLAKIYKLATDSVEKAKKKQAHTYNLRRKPCTFQVGDLVYKKNFPKSSKINYVTSKLEPKFVGLFRIAEQYSKDQFRLENLSGKDEGRWSSVNLKSAVNNELEK